jgi:S-adenosylmethionine:tRNA ribosyltransferase-isomerase
MKGATRVLAAAFDFDLPDELIAQHPVEPREQSRLMVIDRAGGTISHHQFAELPALLDGRDVLARNNTRVIPARLIGHREATGGKWEGLFLRDRDDGAWEVLATTRGRPISGERVVVGQGLTLVLEGRGDGGQWVVRPLREGETDQAASTFALLERHGQTPLPPYIRKGKESAGDRTRYQTIYALQPGSVAAPTAGLHFSESVFLNLTARGIAWIDLTLHVGIGTFRPIEAETIAGHVMHSEWADLSAEAIATLNARRARGGRIVAVGTTSARTLETASASGILKPFTGPTSLFIQPGHVFRGVDALITNFHLPRSSLLVLVTALAGVDLIRAAYAEAIQLRYRFFSYGDAMLIL